MRPASTARWQLILPAVPTSVSVTWWSRMARCHRLPPELARPTRSKPVTSRQPRNAEGATLADVYSGAEKRLACRSLVIVGVRSPRDELYRALIAQGSGLRDAGIDSVTRIGDAFAPGAIVHAVHSGHRYAREFDAAPAAVPYTRDYPV